MAIYSGFTQYINMVIFHSYGDVYQKVHGQPVGARNFSFPNCEQDSDRWHFCGPVWSC